jgi:hypothetical protein
LSDTASATASKSGSTFNDIGLRPGEDPDDDIGNDASNYRRTNILTVDEAIKSPLFWGYACCMDVFDEVLGGICTWTEGCPCHTKCVDIRGRSRHSMGHRRGRQHAALLHG